MAEFIGFPREFFSYFDGLKKHNSKEWFENNRKHYKKVPRGYETDHPNAEFLLYNGLTAWLEEKVPDAFYSDAIIDYAYSHYRNMLPLHRWLKKMLDR
jgi:hypothetical protein